MTREEAIEVLNGIEEVHGALPEDGNKIDEALSMAIKALEQEPCEDAISRSAAIKAIDERAKRIKNEDTLNGLAGAVGILFELPSVNPAPSGDAVSRQAVIDVIDNWVKKYGILAIIPTDEVTPLFDSIHKLHSVNPQKWIPVSERSPASDEDVLVTNGRGMYVGWIDPTDKGWRVDSESEYFMEDVIAWQPLPKPYEPQESEEEYAESNN